MYAKIENGQVTEYPLIEGDLQKRFPQYKFPLDSNEESNGIVVPEGYVRIVMTRPPVYNMYSHCTQGTPALIDGVWKQTWIITPLTEEEKQQYRQYFARTIVEKRNKLLADSDIRVLPDVWDTYTDQQKKNWSSYRQALRDITTHENFPTNIQDEDWPLEPATFTVSKVYSGI